MNKIKAPWHYLLTLSVHLRQDKQCLCSSKAKQAFVSKVLLCRLNWGDAWHPPSAGSMNHSPWKLTAINFISRTINQLHSQILLSRSTANMSNKSKGISPSVTIITGAWAIPCGVGNEACDAEPAVIPVLCLLVGAQLFCDGDNMQDKHMDTHNPATSISGHVTVHWHPLAEVPIDGDGVDPTQRVSIHQMLGTVLRVSKDTSSCKIIKKGKIQAKRHFSPMPQAPLVTVQENSILAPLVTIQEKSVLTSAFQVIPQDGEILHLPSTSENLLGKNVCIY